MWYTHTRTQTESKPKPINWQLRVCGRYDKTYYRSGGAFLTQRRNCHYLLTGIHCWELRSFSCANLRDQPSEWMHTWHNERIERYRAKERWENETLKWGVINRKQEEKKRYYHFCIYIWLGCWMLPAVYSNGMIEWLTKPIISSFSINLNVLTY